MELVVVLTVAAVLIAIAAPKVDLARYKVEAAARQVEGVLQQAQRYAVQRQHQVIVRFDTTTQTMRVTFDTNNSGALDAGERQTETALLERTRFVAAPAGLGGAVVPAISGQNLSWSSGHRSLVFRRDGAASSNLEVYLGSEAQPPTHLRALSIIQSTGRAQMYRLSGSLWKREGM